MCGEMCLELDVDELRGMISEDASAREQVIVLGFSSGVEETTFCRTNEMVDGNLLSGMEMSGAEDANPVSDSGDMTARRGTSMLSAIGSATWRVCEP